LQSRDGLELVVFHLVQKFRLRSKVEVIEVDVAIDTVAEGSPPRGGLANYIKP